MEVAEVLLPIDLRLRFALFGLECAVVQDISAAESERAFRETEKDQVAAKKYTFHESPGLEISGFVDEYEPERMRIRV